MASSPAADANLVCLPAPLDITTAAQPTASGVGLRVAGVSRKVLVVDDHHDAAESMRLLLTSIGDQVRVAYGCEAAL